MRNEILTTYYAGVLDPQRQREWKANFNDLLPLLQSIDDSIDITVITNVFDNAVDGNIRYVSRPCIVNPYFQRWIHYYQYLRDNPDIEFAFCVDATDVEMVNIPFDEMKKGVIYCGDEPDMIGQNDWLRKYHHAKELKSFFDESNDVQMVNAGVVGGDRKTLMSFIHAIVKMYHDNLMELSKRENESVGSTDMGTFNYVAYKVWKGKLEHGRKVTNVFKSFIVDRKSWFKHK